MTTTEVTQNNARSDYLEEMRQLESATQKLMRGIAKRGGAEMTAAIDNELISLIAQLDILKIKNSDKIRLFTKLVNDTAKPSKRKN